MALFKISKGLSANLPVATTEGSVYFTTDKGEFFVDTATSADDVNRQRVMVNGLAYIIGSSCDQDGAWIATQDGLNLRDGLAIIYKPDTDGSNSNEYNINYIDENNFEAVATLSYTCLNLNQSGWHKCFLSPNKFLKNEIKKDSISLMVYDSSLDNGNGGWMIIGGSNESTSIDSFIITSEIKEDAQDEIPTSGAVINYIKSLAYDGQYELTFTI